MPEQGAGNGRRGGKFAGARDWEWEAWEGRGKIWRGNRGACCGRRGDERAIWRGGSSAGNGAGGGYGAGGRCGSLAVGAARCGRQRKCGKNAVKSLTGGGRGRIFRALTRWPAARAAAAVHTEHGQRGTGGGAAVGETFTGAGAGAMTYLIFRRLHYGSI